MSIEKHVLSGAPDGNDKTTLEIFTDLKALLAGEIHWLPALANTAAFLFTRLPDISWAGFYLYRENSLTLGPFQGKIACTDIGIGKGVCGSAFLKQKTLIVPNVNEFPGHIACDPDSRSEIVVPLLKKERCLGVLDVDSTSFSRFTPDDARLLEKIAAYLVSNCNIAEFADH